MKSLTEYFVFNTEKGLLKMELTSLYKKGKVFYSGIIGNNIFQKARLHLNFKDAFLIIEEKK